jgi:hypothetical protein
MRGSKLWTCLFHFFLFGLLAEHIIAAPPLTTIQDVIYKADGTRFNGVAYIEWKAFVTPNQVPIGTQTLTISIVDGNLTVRLVPTTNSSTGGYYEVRFYSDGRIQFSERWAVPPSANPINLSTVRAATSQVNGGVTLAPAALSIGDIPNLTEELAARPVRGLGYASNRALRSGAGGVLEAITGNLTDCVRVDGTSSPCASNSGSYTGPGFVDGETPTGLVNGSNTVFSLASQPSPATSLALYRNGVYLTQGLDYTLSADSITMLAGATPTTGDILKASYRTAAAGNPTSTAGGALTGNYPNPQIAAGVISNSNISSVAGIVESKLALNFPTHSSANDPSAAEKAALSGTAGAPSATNKFVTANDGRLTDARTPLGHPLLSANHSDTTAGAVARGDLIVGQGQSPAWSKLSLGSAGRCLTSNGVDAIWNTCLYTGFQAGAIPFVNASGNLSENIFQLRWDASNRRLSVGSSLADATANVHDLTGTTGLIVRAGASQDNQALTRWQDPSGVDLATVQPDGTVSGLAVQVTPTASRAPWRDAGLAADPASRVDGDSWYNTTVKARKTYETGQTHTVSQVICAEEGVSNDMNTAQVIATCSLPPGFLRAGDRLEVMVDAEQVGPSVPWNLRVQWGATQWMQRALGVGETSLFVRGQASLHSGGATLAAQHFNGAGAMLIGVLPASDPFQAGLVVVVSGWVNTISTGSSVAVRNLTVIRHPAQVN